MRNFKIVPKIATLEGLWGYTNGAAKPSSVIAMVISDPEYNPIYYPRTSKNPDI